MSTEGDLPEKEAGQQSDNEDLAVLVAEYLSTLSDKMHFSTQAPRTSSERDIAEHELGKFLRWVEERATGEV